MYLRYAKVRDTRDPLRANYGDAGLDFFVPNAFEAVWLAPHDRVNIPSGIKVEVPHGWALVFFNKSGIAVNHGLFVGACVVDHGYRGEIHLNVVNTSVGPVEIRPGMKLAQALMLQVGAFVPQLVDEAVLYDSHPTISGRGSGGFGSTGI